jgi:serine/threonine protein phosphatase 1
LIQIFPQNLSGRDFAVGDIHGHFSALVEGMRAIGFDESHDRLFSVGDLVDRGPESAQVVDWLDKPWFHAVRGNHEVMACAAISGDEDSRRYHQANGGGWLDAVAQAERKRIGQVLRGLHLAVEVQTVNGPVGLIHADMPTDDWQDIRKGALTPRDAAYCVWSIDRYQRRYTATVRNVRAVVHGHMTIGRMAVLGNAYFIDTNGGGKDHGHFTFLELATLQAHRGSGGQFKAIPKKYR